MPIENCDECTFFTINAEGKFVEIEDENLTLKELNLIHWFFVVSENKKSLDTKIYKEDLSEKKNLVNLK